jgi:putative hydrolase of the HAD superfamily
MMNLSSQLRLNVSRWQAVVFDLDDTLYPESAYVLSGFNAVSCWAVDQLGIPEQAGFEILKNLYLSGVRGNTFNLWLTHFGVQADERLIHSVIDVYRAHNPIGLSLHEDARLVIPTLKKRVRLGIVTDGYLQVQQKKYHALGLDNSFESVVFTDELGRDNWKPSIKPFIHVCQQLQVDPDAAIYVGDNPLKDFLGAKRIGMYTIQVNRGEMEYADRIAPTSEHAPHLIIPSLLELLTTMGFDVSKS